MSFGRITLMTMAVFSIVTSTSWSQSAMTAPGRSIYPPWQHGRNNDAIDRGLAFTVPEVDNLADFHGDLTAPKLVLYVGGNYFFAMAPLVEAFEEQHPEFKGGLFGKRYRRVSWSNSSKPTGE